MNATATKTVVPPTPWYVHTTADQYARPVIVSREGRDPATDHAGYVVTVAHFDNTPGERERAEFIARRVNAHDDLVAALEKISQATPALGLARPNNELAVAIGELARAALAKAAA